MADKSLESVKDDLLSACRRLKSDPAAENEVFKLVSEANKIEDKLVRFPKKELKASKSNMTDRTRAWFFIALLVVCPPIGLAYLLYSLFSFDPELE